MTLHVNQADGRLYSGNQLATDDQWRAWRAETKAAEQAAARRPRSTGRSGYTFDMDEDGIISNLRRAEEPPQVDYETEIVGEALAALHRAAQALDSVKERETYRASRLRAAADGKSIPGRIGHGGRVAPEGTILVGGQGPNPRYMPVGSVAGIGAVAARRVWEETGPREVSRLEAIEADGGGQRVYPLDGLPGVQARAERDELDAIARREAALDVLRRKSPHTLAKAADPGRPRALFNYPS